MDVDQIPQSGKHTLEVRLTETKVPSQSLREDLFHREQHQTMVLLREHELVYMFLSLHLALAMIDEAQRDVTSDRGAPGIGFLLPQRQLGIYLLEIAYGELMNVVAEIKFFPSAEM